MLGALSASTVLGLLLAASAYQKRAIAENRAWIICSQRNVDAIARGAGDYLKQHMGSNVTIEILVRSKVLPESAPIYMCPKWFGVRRDQQVPDERQDSLECPYQESPYRIIERRGGWLITCRSHTNIVRMVMKP
jgi:hypothetical protein